jgi:hypothetical protein
MISLLVVRMLFVAHRATSCTLTSLPSMSSEFKPGLRRSDHLFVLSMNRPTKKELSERVQSLEKELAASHAKLAESAKREKGLIHFN